MYGHRDFDKRQLPAGGAPVLHPRAGGFLGQLVRPLQNVLPIVDAFAEENQGKVKVGKVNIDDEPELPPSSGDEHPHGHAVQKRPARPDSGGRAAKERLEAML